MMMDEPAPSKHTAVIEFDEALKETLAVHAKALYASRALEMQLAAAEALEALTARAVRLKAQANADGDEDAAARLLMGECFCEGLRSRARLWIAFREGRMDDAWASLIRAQTALEAAIRAHPVGAQAHQVAAEMQALEVLLFPSQMFISTGMLILQSRCSVCDQPFGRCDHVQGRVYEGEFAGRIVSEAEPIEISHVEVPDDKMCRALTIESDGVMRNALTWEPVAEEKQD